ncbi:MAG: tRNA (adenosine(37)-N6)-threonylcarbamoyltransferase complex ATPase subunit type 1 TsaE [Propionibacteriaceae bacterium]|nr:tRNA (adenosine(37)-N6)-threonylcarbamoyltransferase complex ATPase subunit type 1 TsaE [Propionibacteriaceae bacterium]
MHTVGRELAGLTRGGDLVILVGELGAGKTQLAQGIGQGLGVAGPVTSPTFVIARIHRAGAGRPDLVHVDAYRLGSAGEIDDLDLEAEMATAVTVVEWGRGFVEHLSDHWLAIEIRRSDDVDDETREVVIEAVGERWANLVPDWERLVNEAMGRDAAADRDASLDGNEAEDWVGGEPREDSQDQNLAEESVVDQPREGSVQ